MVSLRSAVRTGLRGAGCTLSIAGAMLTPLPSWAQDRAAAGNLSPLFADMHGFPPLLIHVGSEVLLDDALAIDRKVRAAGGESHLEVWPEMLHVWHIQTASLPQAHDALQRAGEFLIGHLEK